MFDLTTIFHGLQRQLFPALEEELGALSALDQQFCEVISLTDLGRFTLAYEWGGEVRRVGDCGWPTRSSPSMFINSPRPTR